MLELKDQKVYDIGGVKFGGIPGENPTVLIGSIFHHEHKIVIDERRGKFDREKAGELIKRVEELSDDTGVPTCLDVVIPSKGAMQKYIDFVAARARAKYAQEWMGFKA